MNSNEIKQDESFAKVLDDNETIVKCIKPNRIRYVVIGLIMNAILFLLLLGLGIAALILGKNGIDLEMNSEDILAANVIGWVMIGISIAFIAFSVANVLVRYKRVLYCLTNKRIIAKTGFIGVDYTSIDLKLIGFSEVKVGLLDKMMGSKSTGSIFLGSTSAPAAGQMRSFALANIDNPYELYKELKSQLALLKKTN